MRLRPDSNSEEPSASWRGQINRTAPTMEETIRENLLSLPIVFLLLHNWMCSNTHSPRAFCDDGNVLVAQYGSH